MTDEIREQISVFIDDELSAEECEFFVRRLQRDSASRAHYVKYQLIGAAIRSELGPAEKFGELRRRVQSALSGAAAQELTVAPKGSGLKRMLKPVLGVGIAASVAAVALIGVRMSSDADLDTLQAPTVLLDSQLELLEPPSYVVPLQSPQPRLITPPIRLTNYLMHHGGVASYLNRTSVHSNLVSRSGAPEVEDDVE